MYITSNNKSNPVIKHACTNALTVSKVINRSFSPLNIKRDWVQNYLLIIQVDLKYVKNKLITDF